METNTQIIVVSDLQIIILAIQLIQIPIVFIIFVVSSMASKVMEIKGFKFLIGGFLFNLMYIFYFVLLYDKSPINIIIDNRLLFLGGLEPIINQHILSTATSFCFFLAGIAQFTSRIKISKIRLKRSLPILLSVFVITIFLFFINHDNTLPIANNLATKLFEFTALMLVAVAFIRSSFEYAGRKLIGIGFLLWGLINLIAIIPSIFPSEDHMLFYGFLFSCIAKILIIFGIYFWYINKEKDAAKKLGHDNANRNTKERTTKALESILTTTFHEIHIPLNCLEKSINIIAPTITRNYRFKAHELIMNYERVFAIIYAAQNSYSKGEAIQFDIDIINSELYSNLKLEIVKINALIEIAVQSISRAYKGINFKLEYGGNCYVYCDQHKIIQVFINLFKNAYEAYEENALKEIKVKTYIQNDRTESHINKFVVVEIEDNASGIKDDIKDRIWEKGYSTKESNNNYLSRGEGLYIVMKIISYHEGSSIIVASNSNNKEEKFKLKGTNFILKFPHISISD